MKQLIPIILYNLNFITARITFTCILYLQCTCDLYHIHIMSFSSYNGYKLNSHLTCFEQGFIAQLVECCTAAVVGSNPVGASEFFLGSICNCLTYFITARITFNCSSNIITVEPAVHRFCVKAKHLGHRFEEKVFMYQVF